MADRLRILISVPNGEGWIHKHVATALLKLMNDRRVERTIILPTHRPYVNNLNRIVKQFLREGYDFWINIDADNPPTKSPIDLCFLDKDVIGLPTPVWHNEIEGDRPYYLNAMIEKEGGWTPFEDCVGLKEVDSIGSGCFVISREVVQAMRDDGHFFFRKWNDEGIVEMGHDFLYFKKVRELGFKVWAHFDYMAQHFNELELIEVIQSTSRMGS